MPQSNIGAYVELLHRTIVESNRRSSLSNEILDGIYTGEGDSVGIEIYSGKLVSDESKKIVKRALSLLHSRAFLLQLIARGGYTPVTVRGILNNYDAFKGESIYNDESRRPGLSDARLVIVDIDYAISQASVDTQVVALSLIEGYNPKEISVLYGFSNCTRMVRRAVKELADILEGRV